MRISTDVDIDVANRDNALLNLEHICARIDSDNGTHRKHLTGVYFQNIPRDPYSNISVIDYKVAADNGYFKIDMLNVYFYEDVKNEDHLIKLMNQEPEWELFLYKEITDQLFHLNGHSDLLIKYKPKSVEDLAMILAIIRPSKAYLQNSSWEKIRKEVWIKTDDEKYSFKKAHGIAYRPSNYSKS